MPPTPIYLDHNSTTPLDPRVLEAMARAWREHGANPASQHAAGRRARRVLEEAREGILNLLGAKTGGMDADQLVFTSGGTEANNLAVTGILGTMQVGHRELAKEYPETVDDLVISAIEHPSVAGSAAWIGQQGLSVKVVSPIDDAGRFVESFLNEFDAFPYLVSIVLANNEVGIIHPISDIARIARESGVLIHTDAVQAAGKIPVHFRDLGVDAMTVAPHKFHGPIGIGALVLKHGLKVQPRLHGGFQQAGLRPGTENVALAVGFHEALRLATAELAARAAHMGSLRDELERLLRSELPDMVIVGQRAPRLPNTSCLAFPGLDRQALVMALDLAGVACSTGSACASGSSEPSPTLVAMGLPQAVIRGAIRFSLGAFTRPAEIDEAARRILNTVKHLKSAK